MQTRTLGPFEVSAIGLGCMNLSHAYGAVFDFVHLHAGGWSWYVFNVADAGIVFGVVGLVYDGLVLERRRDLATRGPT